MCVTTIIFYFYLEWNDYSAFIELDKRKSKLQEENVLFQYKMCNWVVLFDLISVRGSLKYQIKL